MVVTGASSGIGAACARAFAAEGARVVVHYHLGENRAHEVAEAIGAAGVARADRRVESDADRLFEDAKNEVARISKTARVNAVAPGWTTSPMTRGLLDDANVEPITRTMPLGKVATAEDVAARSSSSRPTPSRATSPARSWSLPEAWRDVLSTPTEETS